MTAVQADLESLARHQTPEWFRDAKVGVRLDVPQPSKVRVLGHGPVAWQAESGGVEVDLPAGYEAAPAIAFVLENAS